jgi:hypothetical protein
VAVELVNIDGYLFHGGVGLGNAGALVDHPGFNALNIGGYLVHRGGALGHVAGKLGSDVKETD